MPSAAAIGRIQNASHFAGRVFKAASAVCATCVFRIEEKAPVEVRPLRSRATISSLRIRGKMHGVL